MLCFFVFWIVFLNCFVLCHVESCQLRPRKTIQVSDRWYCDRYMHVPCTCTTGWMKVVLQVLFVVYGKTTLSTSKYSENILTTLVCKYKYNSLSSWGVPTVVENILINYNCFVYKRLPLWEYCAVSSLMKNTRIITSFCVKRLYSLVVAKNTSLRESNFWWGLLQNIGWWEVFLAKKSEYIYIQGGYLAW